MNELTPKQIARLKALANPISHRYLLGKADIDDSFLDQLDKALEAKELIKVGLLPASPLKAKDVAVTLSHALSCHVVQVIGKVVVLYRPSKKHLIDLR